MDVRRSAPLALMGILMGAMAIVATTDSTAAPVTFTETFDGVPLAPQPFDSPHWDVQVHERQQVSQVPGYFTPLNAQHGPGCEGPSVTHLVDTQEKAVFRCNDHIMTSLNGGEYGVIYLTPDHMLDWSGGSATLDFSVSTLRMSSRDWIDFYITPFVDNMATPLEAGSPDLNGQPRNYIQVSIAHQGSLVVNGVQRSTLGSGSALSDGIPAGVDQSASRQPFRLTISNGLARFERLGAYPRVYFTGVSISPGFTQGIVQFGHHSYSPEKDGAGVPATWHWDAVTLDPAVPFTMNRANQEEVFGAGPHTVSFDPAPAGAYLRFAAWGEATVNGVVCAPQGSWVHYESAQSYLCPIPEGSMTATIQLRGLDWYSGGPYMAKEFSVWSLSGGVPSPSPTSFPSTATEAPPSPPSATATSSPTSTATPSFTPVPPTATPTRTPTSTPTPVLRLCTTRWGSTTVINHGYLTRAECEAR